jgi:predicted Na+-dependent transporter
MKVLTWITDHLLYFVTGVGAFSLLFPQVGSNLGGIVTSVLGIMVLNVSMTIKVEDLQQIRKYPFILPNVLTLFGGVTFKVPTLYLIIELAVIIIIPVVIGLLLNYHSKSVREKEQTWSGLASVCWVILVSCR